ncbi:peptidylprolyl isomerase [Lysobacter sp. Root916]|uniref:FKBP-type peptidyl-prolyl cis-trans isomerase n=1 Tax=Lysobacter sp. Root916 TaxID=1736606 RepID=UPI00070C2441|nr:FKBP-type peptidyl-prolyl cis-trans isomerase [Lysobacter sp. Root916]KRD40192.1 peptidylprolyl isomerase [Lysobacter sp. Root916]
MRPTLVTLVCGALLSGTLLLGGCARHEAEPAAGGRVQRFEWIDERPGTGPAARSGQDVSVHYTGWLYDEKAADKRGRKFDSSVDRGKPFSFLLGAGRVVRGWDEGIAGMQVGGKRVLMLPPEYGYGADGAGGGVIPPDASMVFEVELLGVREHVPGSR